jgi:hypothetical protein
LRDSITKMRPVTASCLTVSGKSISNLIPLCRACDGAQMPTVAGMHAAATASVRMKERRVTSSFIEFLPIGKRPSACRSMPFDCGRIPPVDPQVIRNVGVMIGAGSRVALAQ